MQKVIVGILVAMQLGCATAIDGTAQQVSFESVPAGVEVYKVDGELLGVTPFTKEMGRGGDKHFVARKAGYQAQAISIDYKANSTTHGNALSPVTFFIGDAVDTVSGAKIDLNPKVSFTMQPAQ
ncbi:hypothetical protein ACK34P_19275 [Aeromonas veronii]|nr:hypothetical protein [Aeromonas jandaei]